MRKEAVDEKAVELLDFLKYGFDGTEIFRVFETVLEDFSCFMDFGSFFQGN